MTALTDTSLPLAGVRILSLALNVPGPVALQRLSQMGGQCTKVNPPAGDPMQHYTPSGYAELHAGIAQTQLNLKQASDLEALHGHLAQSDVLLTSFRPSALAQWGLTWPALQARHPHLAWVEIVGAPGAEAERAGHDLTYQAEAGLIGGLEMPSTLFADMAGALLTVEAVLAAVLTQKNTGQGSHRQIALSDAALYLAWPRKHRMTTPDGAVGGAHIGYGLYACRDGRVALAALEPHFAERLCRVTGLGAGSGSEMDASAALRLMFEKPTRVHLQGFFANLSRAEIEALAQTHDLPLHTLPPADADSPSA